MEQKSQKSYGDFCTFFFPSRSRHTRYWRDWSSDVCSSDLTVGASLPIFTKLATDAPTVQTRQLLATCLVETGNNAKALEILEPLIAGSPADTGLLYLKDRKSVV